MRLAARLLTIFAIAMAFGLALRAGLGAFSLAGVRIASPLGLESCFACAFLALLFVHTPGKHHAEWSVPLAAALALIALAYAPNLSDPFLSDDYILAARATFEPARLLALFHTPGGDGSFRPLGYVYFGLLRRLFGANPLAWHSVALAIHLTNCALLCFIVKELWAKRPLAAAAALLFGLHGTRPESVAWSAGNFDLLACAFTFAATLCALRQRMLASCTFVVLGILSKESAYAAPAVMLGLAWAGGRVRESRMPILAAAAICATMLAWRWTMFHGPGGYIDPSTGQAQVLSFHLGSALKAVLLRVWALMLFPVNWDAFNRSLPLAVAILMSAAALVFSTPPTRRVLLALLASTVAALLPAYHLALIGQDLNGSRILYLPAAAFCVLCAHLVHTKRLAAAALILASGVILRVNLSAWHEDAILADQVCAGTTAQAPIHDRKGIVFFANGYAECRELKKR
ncbi:MAG: hypothetical protein WBY44_21405 [Bryobacteraceae bacterium]